MSNQQNNPADPPAAEQHGFLKLRPQQWLVLGGFIAITVSLRLVNTPIANFGSMLALTLLCGSVSRSRIMILLPLLVRLATDILVHFQTGYGYFPSWPFDYGAYVLIFGLGLAVNSRRYGRVVSAGVASIGVYFLLSNFGSWIMLSDYYTRDPAGLFHCYVNAIPFARGTIAGNLILTPVFFFAWNQLTQPVKAAAAASLAENV